MLVNEEGIFENKVKFLDTGQKMSQENDGRVCSTMK